MHGCVCAYVFYTCAWQLLEAISDKLSQRSNNIRPIFRTFDEDKSGTISYSEFRHGLKVRV